MTQSMDYVDKITKLLTKAESTTPDEAEALRDKAFALMAKFQVDQAEIDSRRTGSSTASEEIVRDCIMITGIYKMGIMYLVNDVVKAYGTTTGYVVKDSWDHRTNKLATEYWVVGFESDVKQVRLLIDSLMLQSANEMISWWKTFYGRNYLSRSESQRSKREFFIAFGRGAADRIRAARQRILNQTAGTGAELVLRDKKTTVEDWLNENLHIVKGRNTHRKGGHHEAYAAGRRAGERANTGDTQVGKTHRQELES